MNPFWPLPWYYPPEVVCASRATLCMCSKLHLVGVHQGPTFGRLQSIPILLHGERLHTMQSNQQFLCTPLHGMHNMCAYTSRATLCMCSKLHLVCVHQGLTFASPPSLLPILHEERIHTMQSNEQFLYAPLHAMHNLHVCASRATLCM